MLQRSLSQSLVSMTLRITPRLIEEEKATEVSEQNSVVKLFVLSPMMKNEDRTKTDKFTRGNNG